MSHAVIRREPRWAASRSFGSKIECALVLVALLITVDGGGCMVADLHMGYVYEEKDSKR